MGFYRFYNTIRYLRLRQVYWRIFFSARRVILRRNTPVIKGNVQSPKFPFKLYTPFLHEKKSYNPEGVFLFVNVSHCFTGEVDWNYSGKGRLWVYNLNYFDFLLQKEIDKESGLYLIKDFCNRIDSINDGLEPYPTSLRCINWIKFLIKYNIKNPSIDRHIWAQLNLLSRSLEYHVMGNHLLENACSLFVGAMYFGNMSLLTRAQELLKEELDEQVLPDGAHYERSPMYHNIILARLLDCINIIQSLNCSPSILNILKDKAKSMLGWAQQVSFRNGNIPLVNDAAFGIAHETSVLAEYAARLGLTPSYSQLKECGFRKIMENGWELFLDIGNISPSYQPGHAHADTFTFELYNNAEPIIVDTGTSTYDIGHRRSLERSTSSHNTVVLNNVNSSDVWASHRVGHRAKVRVINESVSFAEALHDGYRNFGALHYRSFNVSQESIEITDRVTIEKQKNIVRSEVHIHFHPNTIIKQEENKLLVNNSVRVSFTGAKRVDLLPYSYAPEFNKLIDSVKCRVVFEDELHTFISK